VGVKNGGGGEESFTTGEALVGRTFLKKFPGYGMFEGRIIRYLDADNLYAIQYDDSDEEELVEYEVCALLYSNLKTEVKKERTDFGLSGRALPPVATLRAAQERQYSLAGTRQKIRELESKRSDVHG